MRIIKHEKLREFMLGLDYEEQDTLNILVKYHTQYVYTARIIYNSYSRCWRCISNQTTRGSGNAIEYDYRNVRAQVEHEVKAFKGFVVGDINFTDAVCLPATPSNTAISDTSADANGEEPFDAQVLNWLSEI